MHEFRKNKKMNIFAIFIILVKIQPNLATCGIKSPDPRQTLGGRRGFDPWVVSIGFHDDQDYNHQCTGAILTKNTIISAGHCFVDEYNDFVVRAGKRNPRHLRASEHKIKRISFHPKYDNETFYYDVALVHLETDLDFSRVTINSICLPENNYKSTQSIVGRVWNEIF